MKLKLMTPEKLVLTKDVESVTLPGVSGQMTVLDGHDILVAELKKGILYFRFNDTEGKPCREDFKVGKGTVEVTRDAAKVFVESAKSVLR